MKDAKELTEEILDVDVRELGKEHPTTLTTMTEIAYIYDDLSDFQKAEELGSEVGALKKKVLGDKDVSTLDSM